MRLGASCVAALAMLWMLVFAAAQVSLSEQGSILFWGLAIFSFLYCLFCGVIWTTNSFNAEKREGTLGLLFLTHLKGYDVVLGKMVSSSVSAAFALIGIVPMLALGLLLGGVELTELGWLIAVLVTTALLSLACGGLASAVFDHEGQTIFATLILLLLVNGLPFQISLMLLD
jgi:hypothetical protein